MAGDGLAIAPAAEAARHEAACQLAQHFATHVAPRLGRDRWWTAFEDWLHARRHACRHGDGAEPAHVSNPSNALDPILPTGPAARSDGDLLRKCLAAGLSHDEARAQLNALGERSEELALRVRGVVARCTATGERGEVHVVEPDDVEGELGMVRVSCAGVTLECSASHWRKLRRLYEATSAASRSHPAELGFAEAAFCVLARYSALQGGHARAGGMQAAVPAAVLELLQSGLGVRSELFASPLNCLWPGYASAFADTDAHFGSRGSFFELRLREGSYEANPPFDDVLMLHACHTMHTALQAAQAAGRPLSICAIVPYRPASAGWLALTRSPFCKACVRLRASEHSFTHGAQWLRPSLRPSAADSTVAVLQSTSGSCQWPFTEQLRAQLVDAFAARSPQPLGTLSLLCAPGAHTAAASGAGGLGKKSGKRKAAEGGIAECGEQSQAPMASRATGLPAAVRAASVESPVQRRWLHEHDGASSGRRERAQRGARGRGRNQARHASGSGERRPGRGHGPQRRH